MAEQLVAAKSELKKQHNCDQKQVVISPFTVKIDESGRNSKNKSPSKEFQNTISKPFTFSYMQSSKKRKNLPSEGNSPSLSTSYISHFVHGARSPQRGVTVATNT